MDPAVTHRPRFRGNARTSLDPVTFAEGAIRASKRHLLLSVALTASLAVGAIAVDAGALHVAALAVVGAVLVTFNLLRVRAATRSLRSGAAGAEFILAQRRSHLLRGCFYLVASPVLAIGVAVGLAHEQPAPPLGAWLMFAAIGAILGYGWVWWFRALRRVERWQPPA